MFYCSKCNIIAYNTALSNHEHTLANRDHIVQLGMLMPSCEGAHALSEELESHMTPEEDVSLSVIKLDGKTASEILRIREIITLLTE